LSSARDSSDVGLGCAIAFIMPRQMAKVKEQEPSKAGRGLKSAVLQALLARHDSKRDILAILDLEDTPENRALRD